MVCCALTLLVGPASWAQESAAGSTPFIDESTIPLPEAAIPLGEDTTALQAVAPVISTGDFIRMLLILGVVVAAIYGVFYLIRRATVGRVPENELISLLGSKGLSTGRMLHVIRVGNSVYLVGAAENSISLISELTDKETLDAVALQEAQAETAAANRRPFQELLADLLPGGGGTPAAGAGLGLLQRQQERVRQLGQHQ